MSDITTSDKTHLTNSFIIDKIWLEFLLVGVGMLANTREW
jgi:hypothetical protein